MDGKEDNNLTPVVLAILSHAIAFGSLCLALIFLVFVYKTKIPKNFKTIFSILAVCYVFFTFFSVLALNNQTSVFFYWIGYTFCSFADVLSDLALRLTEIGNYLMKV